MKNYLFFERELNYPVIVHKEPICRNAIIEYIKTDLDVGNTSTSFFRVLLRPV